MTPAELKHRLLTLFTVFFKISAVAVGGGLTMLPMMSKEFSEDRKWISEEEMVDIVAIVQSVPGIIAVNMAILTGSRVAGLPGVLVASVGVVLPPVIVILLSVIKMSRSVLKTLTAKVIALAGFLLLVVFSVDAVGMIVGAAVVGLVLAWIHYLRLKKAEEVTK